MISPVFVALSLAILTNAYIGPVSDLFIVNKNVAPDGFTRAAVLAGETATNADVPGPLIVAQKNDNFELNVINQLSDTTMLRSTSIHWHGFFQAGTSWADGPAGVNQCPIIPGEAFEYRFQALDQAGTFWYHSHHSTQYCDGLRGAMVVTDPNDPHASLYDIDNEDTVITLADWYHVVAPSAGAIPTPDTTLINGRGRYVGGPTVPLSVINVEANKRYRFRLVSLACDPNYVFSIDGHTMNVIEVDSVNHEPYEVDSIRIFAGQRYSFVLTANQPVDNYWIRANPNIGSTGFTNGINSAILRYQGAPVADPTSTQTPNSNPLVESSLAPHSSAGPGAGSGTPDVAINLAMAFDVSTFRFTVNGASFHPPNSEPILLQIISGAVNPGDVLPADSVYHLPPDSLVELSMPAGAAGGPHPIHLHGHAFDVVRSAGSSTYNYIDPPRRDVVSLGSAGDNVTIRFRTDNPGPWIMHCHIDWHLELGLSVVFAEDTATINTEDPPTEWDNLCPSYIDFLPEFP